jgi:hypothetical protein
MYEEEQEVAINNRRLKAQERLRTGQLCTDCNKRNAIIAYVPGQHPAFYLCQDCNKIYQNAISAIDKVEELNKLTRIQIKY